ncbi:hypothetical protein [Microcoleus sp. B4-D4]
MANGYNGGRKWTITMPRKIRELKAQITREGFIWQNAENVAMRDSSIL